MEPVGVPLVGTQIADFLTIYRSASPEKDTYTESETAVSGLLANDEVPA